jgi:hypothetical protein
MWYQISLPTMGVDAVNWTLFTTEAATVLQIWRQDWGLYRNDVVSALLQRGIPFSTRTTTPQEEFLTLDTRNPHFRPNVGLGWRLKDYHAGPTDYLAYEST